MSTWAGMNTKVEDGDRNGTDPAAAPIGKKPSSIALLRDRRWRKVLRLAQVAVSATSSPDLLDALCLLPRDVYPRISVELLPQIERGVASYAAPYLRYAATALHIHLERAVQNGTIASVAVGAAPMLALKERLASAAEQVVAVLVNAARLTGKISGVNSAERWAAFEVLASDRDYREDCRRRFPVLDNVLSAMTRNAIDAWAEFFERLAADRTALTEFIPGGLGLVEHLQFFAGDPHNGGRSVVLVRGRTGKVVYKPRPLEADQALGRAVEWLAGHARVELRHLPVLGRSGYGWAAFVEHPECVDMAEVEQCFFRSGILMALFHVLGAGDLHHENIICQGAFPYVIDAESLFNGPMAVVGAAFRRQQRARHETLLNLCYLPCIMPMGNSYVDVTGAGFTPGQKIEFARAITVDSETDLMAQAQTIQIAESFNLPKLNGEVQCAFPHHGSIAAGVRLGLEMIVKHRRELLDRPDLMPSFAKVPSRFIPRGTAQYGQIQRNALHPHACASLERHDAALAVLAHGVAWKSGSLEPLLAADVRAIRDGDIPLFRSVADSCSLWTSDGAELPDMFQESGYASATRRIERLGPADIDRQVHAVHLSFGISAGREATQGRHQRVREERVAPANERLAVAIAIGDRLLAQAFFVDGHMFWLGRSLIGTRFSAAMVDQDLYGGAPGIGVFLAELARKTGSARFRRAARQCLRTTRDAAQAYRGRLGAFDGLAGQVFAELAMSRALGQRAIPTTVRHLEQLRRLVPGDRVFDVIGGSAGVLLVALAAVQWPEFESSARALADESAAHLIAAAEQQGDAIAWRTPSSEQPLTGLAHGACGIGLALARYAAAADDSASRTAAAQAFRLAEQSFDETSGLWRDLRHQHGHMIAWCHGAAGMTLARQHALKVIPGLADEKMLRDIRIGLEVLAGPEGPGSDTLCHGRSGNWEPLWLAAEPYRLIADQEVSGLCAHLADSLPPGGDLAEPTPDLMNGWAGIGLQLLRSFDRSVADVTTLSLSSTL
ncbi:MAG: type 2 lanthipeptide synthetase LanM family protein [Sphingomonas bacterium]